MSQDEPRRLKMDLPKLTRAPAVRFSVRRLDSRDVIPITRPCARLANQSELKGAHGCLFMSVITQSIKQSTNQPINLSTYQSINQSVHQAANQSVNQSISQSVSQSIDRSMNQWINGSIDQSVIQALNQSIRQPIHQSIIRSITQSINHPDSFVIQYWHGGGVCRRQLDIYIYIYIYICT